MQSMQRRLAIACSFCACLAFTIVGCNRSEPAGTPRSGVYDRVVRSGALRAAYITYPPAVIKDPSTGELSGIFVETLNKIGSNTGLRVEWTEEVGWGSQIEGLLADRYDIVGSPVWANAVRGKLTMMSIPVYYSGIGLWVRSDDNRFVTDLKLINDPQVKIATVDGETSDVIARGDFPLAQRVSLPQLADLSRMLLDVQTHKADIAFVEPYIAYTFLSSYPGAVKNLTASDPVRVYGNCYMFRPNEPQLKHLLDVAVEDLLNSGYIEALIRKYEPQPGTFYRVAKPYRLVSP